MNAVTESGHTPVLVEEVIHGLNVQSQGRYIDCTYGRGGHSEAILHWLGSAGRLLVLDRDSDAIAAAKRRLGGDARVEAVQASFGSLQDQCARRGWLGEVDGVLFDLGLSSAQLDDAARGFSFLHEGALDMRFDRSSGISAAEWLQEAAEKEIVKVLRGYGEERYARRIAAAIVKARVAAPISSTRHLRDLIVAAVPTKERHKDPATRTFQALRIHINGELAELERALPQVITVLRAGGRMVVISFHSLEDRIVKRFMRAHASGDQLPREIPVMASEIKPDLKIIGKPVKPGDDEVRSNPRARSAVLRVAEKVAA